MGEHRSSRVSARDYALSLLWKACLYLMEESLRSNCFSVCGWAPRRRGEMVWGPLRGCLIFVPKFVIWLVFVGYVAGRGSPPSDKSRGHESWRSSPWSVCECRRGIRLRLIAAFTSFEVAPFYRIGDFNISRRADI